MKCAPVVDPIGYGPLRVWRSLAQPGLVAVRREVMRLGRKKKKKKKKKHDFNSTAICRDVPVDSNRVDTETDIKATLLPRSALTTASMSPASNRYRLKFKFSTLNLKLILRFSY